MPNFFSRKGIEQAARDISKPVTNVLPKVTVAGHRYDLGGNKALFRMAAAAPAVGVNAAPIWGLDNRKGNDVTPDVLSSTVAGALVAGGALTLAGSPAAGAGVGTAGTSPAVAGSTAAGTGAGMSGAGGLVTAGVGAALPNLVRKPGGNDGNTPNKTTSSLPETLSNLIKSPSLWFLLIGGITVIYITKKGH